MAKKLKKILVRGDMALLLTPSGSWRGGKPQGLPLEVSSG